jgi:hypothetical protein
MGTGQSFSSYGGIIAGQKNTLSGPFSDVFGESNTASSVSSSVSGGLFNTASGFDSSVSGGDSNTASEGVSAILGGCGNFVGVTPNGYSPPTCTGVQYDSIGGGFDNQADGGRGSFVAGGNHNTANGDNSVSVGGYNNTVAANDGSTLSLFGGGTETLASTTNNESQVGNTLFSP